MSKRETVALHYEVRTWTTITYEIDPDHFKQVTGGELYTASALEIEDYVLDINTGAIRAFDHLDEQFLDETLQDEWTLEN